MVERNKRKVGVMQTIQQFSAEFQSCRTILHALGDENRQHLILTMMQMGVCSGVRVGTITERTNLSRPAVSHHLKILKEAGIVKVRRCGTKNYYSFDNDAKAVTMLLTMLTNAKELMQTSAPKKG